MLDHHGSANVSAHEQHARKKQRIAWRPPCLRDAVDIGEFPILEQALRWAHICRRIVANNPRIKKKETEIRNDSDKQHQQYARPHGP